MAEPSCFILGYTGATGQALVQQLIIDDYFQKIVLVGRRKCDIQVGADDRFIQEVVDYDNIGDYSHVFRDCKVGFCCLGNADLLGGAENLYKTKYNIDLEIFQKIDRDYVINTAAVAKDAGCEQFHVITSINSNIDSKLSLRKIKGEAENGLKQLNFQKLTIYRPGHIIVKRHGASCSFKIAESIYKCCCFPCLYCCCRKTMSIKVEQIATAMIYKAKNPSESHTEILENYDMIQIAQ